MTVSVAALYTVHTDQLTKVVPLVRSLLGATRDPLVRETAAWVLERVGEVVSPFRGPAFEG